MATYWLPTYKTQQADAKLHLLLLADELEQYHASHNTYQGMALTNSLTNFELRIIYATQNTYKLAAIPKTSKDEQCGTFYLDQDGNKTITGFGEVDECW